MHEKWGSYTNYWDLEEIGTIICPDTNQNGCCIFITCRKGVGQSYEQVYRYAKKKVNKK